MIPKKHFKKQKKEYEDNVIEIRRVTRVVAGGKRMSFRAVVVIGNRKGKVGVGVGKSTDVSDSIRKAKADAKKHLIQILLKDNRTILYDVDAKYNAARIRIKPVPEGHGLIAGGSARTVLDLVGIKDISAKLLGTTKNKLNNAMVAVEALKEFEDFSKKEANKEPEKKEETVSKEKP